MVNKIKVAPAEPPEEPVSESHDQEKIRDEPTPPEKISTKRKILYGVGVFTAVVALVLVITLPIVLKNPPEALEAQGWGDWGEWSRCSATCDQGQRSRLRFCYDGQGGTGNADDCPGEAVDNELCNLTKCLSGRAMVKNTCTNLRQSLNITDNLFCDRYAQSVTLNGEVINSPDVAEKGYGVWRLTENNIKRILGYYYFQLVKVACEEVQGFSPFNTLDEFLDLINHQPCLSAVAWVAFLKIEDLLPIPIVFAEQERILKSTSDQIMMGWDDTMAKETEEIQHICRLADIDFDFVIDQSTSVGKSAWKEAMDNIAEYWIRQAIQPNGAKQCGNHVAARKYSGAQTHQLYRENEFHDRWIDFEPPSEEEYSKYSNFTEYIASMFEQEAYKGGATHTAEALRRVREVDLNFTRNGQKFVMVFTDGKSNDPKPPSYPDWPILAEEAKLLHNSVDEVFAYGIGEEGVDEAELQLIASDKINGWYVMHNFTSYIYVINKFILEQGGCDTDRKKPFRRCFIVMTQMFRNDFICLNI